MGRARSVERTASAHRHHDAAMSKASVTNAMSRQAVRLGAKSSAHRIDSGIAAVAIQRGADRAYFAATYGVLAEPAQSSTAAVSSEHGDRAVWRDGAGGAGDRGRARRSRSVSVRSAAAVAAAGGAGGWGGGRL